MKKMETPQKITFSNEPKLSEHEVQSKFNERRMSLIPLVRDFIATHDRFKNKKVNVTFAHEGVSSLVSILEVDNEKSILKIPLGGNHSRSEVQFLKVWEHVGVKVPDIIEQGMLGEYSYILMEYVDAPILKELYSNEECVKKGIYLEMGKMLCLMHEPRAQGYGHVIEGKGEYAKFKDVLLSEDIQERIKYVEEYKLVSDEHGSLSLAFEILAEHVNRENKSSYCHHDFSTSNIFATHPITVFDPSPRFDNNYLDLGRTLTIGLAHDSIFPEQLIEGYFQGESYDKKVLHAAILLNSCMKFPYWNQVMKFKEIKKVQEYLIQNKHLLS